MRDKARQSLLIFGYGQVIYYLRSIDNTLHIYKRYAYTSIQLVSQTVIVSAHKGVMSRHRLTSNSIERACMVKRHPRKSDAYPLSSG
jgi:hypothetical protein